jgi:acyl-CoA thioesterase
MMSSPSEHPQDVAQRVAETMLNVDEAMRGLGLGVEYAVPGGARLSMSVRPDMLNGLAICHGGIIFTLADSAFAVACNSHGVPAVAASAQIDFLAPAREGDVLMAEAREVSLRGKTGIYDVTVTNHMGERIAVFRGRSHRIKGDIAQMRRLGE